MLIRGQRFFPAGKAMYLTGDSYEGTFVEGLRTGEDRQQLNDQCASGKTTKLVANSP